MALWPAAREGFFRVGRKEGAPLAVCSAFKGGGVSGVLAAPGGSDLPVHFVTFGVQHVKFWQSTRLTSSVDGRRGAFGSEGAPKVVVCAAWVARDRLVAGGNAGEIFFFEGSRAVRRMQLQPCPIALLLPLRDTLLTVHANGVVSMLGSGAISEWDVKGLDGAPDVRMLSQITTGHGWRGSSLVLSSRTHLLFLDLSNGIQNVSSCEVLMSQPSEPLTAVCAHPVEPRIYTGSLDGAVRCYRSSDLAPVEARSFRASCGVSCLAVSGVAPGSDASAWLAIGCEDATLSIMGEESFHYVLRRKLSGRRARLTCARFSSTDISGSHPLWLAVGTDDGCIHTFKFKDATCKSVVHTGEETVSKVATLRGHEAPIFDVCFADTLPCNFLISVDTSGKQLVFDVPMARRLPTVALVRDVPFSPWTSPIGWQVQGCWAEQPHPHKAGQALLPQRRFFEIPGRQAIAVTSAENMSVEIYPFPCPAPLQLAPPRLDGPGGSISALLFSIFTDSILATSDTVLFSWCWSPEGETHVQRGPSASPIRPAKAAVMFDTPDGQKHAMAASPAFTPPPRPRSAAGARSIAAKASSKCPSCGNVYTADAVFCRRCGRKREKEKQVAVQTPSPKRADSASGPRVAWGDKEEAAASPASPALPPTSLGAYETPERVAAPAWQIEPPAPAAGIPTRRPKSKAEVAGKIGAPDSYSWDQAGETQRMHEDMEARSRSIQERQQFDSVGLLLSGKSRPHISGVDRLEDRYQESRAGRFQYRAQESGDRYEVEVHLPGGQLVRVTRNPLRRTLSFEGKVVNCWAVGAGSTDVEAERLVVRVPPGFDVSDHPAEVIRNFSEGKCFVAVHRHGRGGRSDRHGAGVASVEECDV
eukprot:TRINITY_DN8694_c0_g1_i1.p1 TRINITY_DN8694_c0_g1~~TRINITY_DN8694_c0_g1_i1.p1  ORF type:complete len:870 (-),score=151.42 TRINITY_DN8694_c0_g1_i1:83-2692(-)